MFNILDALYELGWSNRNTLNINFNDVFITATPISSTETRWHIRTNEGATHFTSEIGPDEYDYVSNKIYSHFNSRMDG